MVANVKLGVKFLEVSVGELFEINGGMDEEEVGFAHLYRHHWNVADERRRQQKAERKAGEKASRQEEKRQTRSRIAKHRFQNSSLGRFSPRQ
ncbi:hypothetical protein FACS1894198_3720 [Clostridia bacterium]|nr:hypothetical protein FACS1894198_3720 [Clostridia bacterium]